jgi:NADH:ubiquinone reductase (H+-translocating)
MHKTHILIVGGGFAGIKTALELSGDDRFAVTLLSDQSSFRYYPTLYQTATGGVPSESYIPLETIFGGKDVKIVKGSAMSVDRVKKEIVTTENQHYHYDILIMALGVVTNYFGIKGLSEYAYSIKSIEESTRFKQHLHQQLIDERQPDLNYIIVGGGPTGIELAGALSQYLKRIMNNHGIKHRAIHIDLVEAAPRLMPRMPAAMSRKISKQLRHLGIKLYLGQTVQAETADNLMVNNKPITSHTVVWTAGVTNHPFFNQNNFKISDHGKVIVDQFLQSEPDIFVLGDNADTQFSGMAQTALHNAVYVAEVIKQRSDGHTPEPYKPKKPIYVMPAGPHWAAVLWGGVQLSGKKGWILRELADLSGFHNFEPWWKATEQWVKEFEAYENCSICSAAMNNLN